ncbi:hypothetical protein, conserved [Plasmodium vivax]|nr:hypothetical protein, conserved [Plasmodium vivax]
MPVCEGDFNQYLDYDCYDKLKKQFLEREDINIYQNILTFYNSYKFPSTANKNTISNIFPKLLKYLSNTHVFFYPDKGQSCNYISYLLYDDIKKEEFGECKSSTFEIFKKFVQDLSSEGINHSCVNKLIHLESDKFQKMLNLYKVYDLYRSVKITENWYYRDNLCSDLQTLIYYYNRFNEKYYKDDPRLRELLENLRPIIQNNTWLNDVSCHVNISNLLPLKTFPKENVEQAEIKENTFQLTHSPQKSTHDKTETKDGETINAIESELPGLEDQLTQEVETLAEPQGELKEEDHGKHQREISQQFPNSLHSFPHRQTYEEIERPLRSGYETDTMHPLTEPNNSRGIVDKIQYALSDTLQNIDPVPVVGVSGGMGALFLLFKYTPVGTFFRGSRRMQRIPSRFDADYAGFMPAFQGYDDGYFPNPHINIAYGRE